MSISEGVLVVSTAVMALATIAIAWNAFATSKAMKESERERKDLYRAMVVANLLCSPQGDNPRLYDFAKKMFLKDYTGETPVLKSEAEKEG